MLLGMKWHQFVRNDEVRRLTGQPKLTAIVQSCQLTLFEHISCMDYNADTKRSLSTLPPEDWRRPRGRPRITWLSTIQQDLRSYNLILPEAMDMAQYQSRLRMWSTYGATQSWVACQKPRYDEYLLILLLPTMTMLWKVQNERVKNAHRMKLTYDGSS